MPKDRKKYFQRWRKANRIKCNAAAARWRARHPNGQREADRRWRENHPERYKARMKASNHKWGRSNPQVWMWHNAKNRARKAGIPFDIVPEDICIPKRCPVFGIPLFRAKRGRTDNSPSLDRRNPKRGYVRGNIAVISFRANRIKNDATLRELRRLVDWVSQ